MPLTWPGHTQGLPSILTFSLSPHHFWEEWGGSSCRSIYDPKSKPRTTRVPGQRPRMTARPLFLGSFQRQFFHEASRCHVSCGPLWSLPRLFEVTIIIYIKNEGCPGRKDRASPSRSMEIAECAWFLTWAGEPSCPGYLVCPLSTAPRCV